jgi:hypothetical protein
MVQVFAELRYGVVAHTTGAKNMYEHDWRVGAIISGLGGILDA